MTKVELVKLSGLELGGEELVKFFEWCGETTSSLDLNKFDMEHLKYYATEYKDNNFSVEIVTFIEWCIKKNKIQMDISEFKLLGDRYKTINKNKLKSPRLSVSVN